MNVSFRGSRVDEEEDEPPLLTAESRSADFTSPQDCCISGVSLGCCLFPRCNKGKCQFPPSVSFSSSCFSFPEKRRLIHFCPGPPRDKKNSAYATAPTCAITIRKLARPTGGDPGRPLPQSLPHTHNLANERRGSRIFQEVNKVAESPARLSSAEWRVTRRVCGPSAAA